MPDAPAIPTAPNIPRNDDVAGFLAAIGQLETEEVPYRAAVISGTREIPADIADAIDSLLDGAIERKGKQEIYTMYDEYGVPSRVDGLRIQMMLQEKHPKTGRHIFFARPPKSAPKVVVVDPNDDAQVDALVASGEEILVAGRCRGCRAKVIAENPHTVQPMPILDREDAWWRVNQVLFPHMFKRHPMLTARVYRDKDQRDTLIQAVVQASK